jgi:hypothetical protein
VSHTVEQLSGTAGGGTPSSAARIAIRWPRENSGRAAICAGARP